MTKDEAEPLQTDDEQDRWRRDAIARQENVRHPDALQNETEAYQSLLREPLGWRKVVLFALFVLPAAGLVFALWMRAVERAESPQQRLSLFLQNLVVLLPIVIIGLMIFLFVAWGTKRALRRLERERASQAPHDNHAESNH